MNEGQPPPPYKPRPPLKTVTTTVVTEGGGKLPSGKPEPKQRTVVKITEVTKVKSPPPKSGA